MGIWASAITTTTIIIIISIQSRLTLVQLAPRTQVDRPPDSRDPITAVPRLHHSQLRQKMGKKIPAEGV